MADFAQRPLSVIASRKEGEQQMKSIFSIAILSALTLVFTLPAALAQPGYGGKRMARNYNPSAEMTIHGTVEDVQQYQRGRVPGIHLIVKSDAETYDVHLGPSTFVSNQGFTFAKGDQIEVLGAKVTTGTGNGLIAREVTKEGKKLTLRDATGRPMWARGRRAT
jgi:hypothetical protein